MDYYASLEPAPPSPYVTLRDVPAAAAAARARLPFPDQGRSPHLLDDVSPIAETGVKGSLLQMTVQPPPGKDASAGPYPERPGEPDCVYYLRTGSCGYGANCRFNHPCLDKMVSTPAQDKEELPQRLGQPECQYYMKTGTCKFGPMCKYHHPPKKAGWDSEQVQLNFLSLPLRPGEKECAYYLRTGSCKFGVTCKFHHPQPAAVGTLLPISSSPVYSTTAPASPVPVPYHEGLPSWPIARAPYIPPGSGLSAPLSYMPVLVSSPQRMSAPGWNTCQGPFGQRPSPDRQQQSLARGFGYGTAPQQIDAGAGGMLGSGRSPAVVTSSTMLSSGLQMDTVFSETPGQRDCHHFMKTGSCKFGANCKYRHSKGISSQPDLNMMGLPLRPGQPTCTFYSKYGICKFGPTCKYDHPVGGLPYNPSASSLHDSPVVPYSSGSTPTTIATTLSEKSFETSKTLPSSADKINSESLENGEHRQIASAGAFQDNKDGMSESPKD